MKEQEFISKFEESIVLATQYTPLFPSVKLAQAALESGWGKKTVGEANNLFGISGTGNTTPYWDGSVLSASTKEEYNGNVVTVTKAFRSYKTYEDSIRDHSYLLMTLSRYKPVRDAATPEDQARALQNTGYATDSSYANKLISIIKQYDLKKLDKKKIL